MNLTRYARPLAAAVLLGGVVACTETAPSATQPEGPRDPHALATRQDTTGVQRREGGLVFRTGDNGRLTRPGGGSGSPMVMAPVVDGDLTYELLASTKAPTSSAGAMPATHVVRGRDNEDLMYVSYAPRGEVNVGAIDIFDLSDPEAPELLGTLEFPDTKIRALGLSGTGNNQVLYAVGTTSGRGFATPAVIERIPLTSRGLPASGTTLRRAIPSYAGLSVAVEGSRVYVSSGAGGTLPEGGLTVLDATTLAQIQVTSFDDARAVATDGATLASLEGPNSGIAEGMVCFFTRGGDGRLTFSQTVRIGGLTTGYDKAVITIAEGFAFATAGAAGGAILSTSGSRPLVTRIPAAGTGREDITNGLSVVRSGNDGVIATADGAAGVRIFASDFPRRRSTVSLELLGRIRGANVLPGSANQVALDAKGEQVVIANGEGAVRIFSLEIDR